ncbi:MAG: alpha/beta hydrolase [Egibacteraceae bacterium]
MTDGDFTHRFIPGTDPSAPTLLLLHGTGGTEDDLLPLAGHLSPGSGVLSPRGKVTEQGMNRWFRRLAEGVFDREDIVARAGELAAFVGAAAHEHGFEPSRVVAVGFSNGANIAAALLLLHPRVLRGAALFSSMLPLRPDTPPDLGHAGVFMSSGRVDPMAPPGQAEALATLLTDAGAAVTLQWHDAGHRLGPEQLPPARDWLTKLATAMAGGSSTLP